MDQTITQNKPQNTCVLDLDQEILNSNGFALTCSASSAINKTSKDYVKITVQL